MSKIITPEDAAAELLRRRTAESSLYEFVKYAWPTIEPGYEYVDGWHIGAICEHLEAVFYMQVRNLLINLPPRSLKTDICDVCYPVWGWLQKPSEKFVYASYAFSIAEDASIKCRALVRSQWFQTRWGHLWQITDDRDTKEYFSNTKGGERIIASVDSKLTGRGGDQIIANDMNSTKDHSDAPLNNAREFWQTVIPTRLNTPSTGRKIVIQQRTDERDISGHILAHEQDANWVKLILPLEYEKARHCVTVPLKSTGGKKWEDPRKKEGESLLPKRWGPDEILSLKRALGSEYNIAGQLQQRPAPAAGGIIRKAWFQRWKSASAPKLEYKVLSIDTALSESKEAAYSAATTWGIFRDEHKIMNAILLGVWRERCEYPELRDRILRMSENYLDTGKEKPKHKSKPDMILIEAKVSGISLIQDLARMGITATKADPSKLGDKIQRVRMITPLLEAGRVWMPCQPPSFDFLRPYADLFVEQCGVFPNAESRDLVDTLSQFLHRMQVSGWLWHPNDLPPGEPEDRQHTPTEAFY